MRKFWKILSLFAAVGLAACAKTPDAITPMSMPANAYRGLTCEQLAAQLVQSESELEIFSSQQRSAATSDAVGVFLIGVPMGSLSGGDKEGLVAQKKGEIISLRAAQRQGGCIS